MPKLKILFDVSILMQGVADTRSRSGIFFVARNILKEIKKRSDVEVVLLPMVIDVVDLFRLREKYFYSLRLFKNPTRVDLFFYSLRNMFKKTRNVFFEVPIVRKGLYVVIKTIERLHLFFHQYDFSKCSPREYIYYSPNRVPPREIKKTKIKCFVTIYDLIPILLDEYKWQAHEGWFGNLLHSLNGLDTYFSISKATKDDFLSHFPFLRSEQIPIVPLAASEEYKNIKDEFFLDKIKEKYGIPKGKKYLFSLCTIEPRKNLIRTVSCFIRFVNKHQLNDFVYVLGGGAGTTLAKKMKREINSFDVNAILPIGYVDDEDLPILYSNAEWFVYTSQYEGFGLPPLEAMQCGCPVITSNNSSLPEVVGDAGIMIDWDSDEQHVEAYEKYYFNEELRKENSRKGLERAKLFSWKITVDKMVSAMKNRLAI